MADSQRIDELRRRVQKDPASIAFAQLAEECRRAGQLDESIDICRAGLAIHPGYLSARVTLGRALVELDQLDDALAELEFVLASAPENLAAIRGVAEIHHKRGELAEALKHYRAALALARNDPDLQQTVDELARKVEPPKPAASADGLSLEQITRELSVHQPTPGPPVAPPKPVRDTAGELEWAAAQMPTPVTERAEQASPLRASQAPAPTEVGELVRPHELARPQDKERDRAVQTIAALEDWLDAAHAPRTDPLA